MHSYRGLPDIPGFQPVECCLNCKHFDGCRCVLHDAEVEAEICNDYEPESDDPQPTGHQ